MRYKRPSCEECIRLASEKAAFYLAYQDAREALKLTPRTTRPMVNGQRI